MNWKAWYLVLVLVLAGLFVFAACKGTTSYKSKGEADLPFFEPVKWDVGLDVVRIDGGPSRADVCLRIVFADAAGTPTGTYELKADAGGKISAPIPPNSQSFEVFLIECPPPSQLVPGQSYALRAFEAFRAPLWPSQNPLDVNRMFMITGLAPNAADAQQQVEGLSIGATLPSDMQVHLWVEMQRSGAYVRLLNALPVVQTNMLVRINQSFRGRLENPFLVGSWDVQEHLVPVTAFNGGLFGTYQNQGSLQQVLPGSSRPAKFSYSYEYTN